jgi:hypothetical protein
VTASAAKIAETRASRFIDTEVTLGTTYFYWINAYDTVENVSGFATYVSATPVVITAGWRWLVDRGGRVATAGEGQKVSFAAG